MTSLVPASGTDCLIEPAIPQRGSGLVLNVWSTPVQLCFVMMTITVAVATGCDGPTGPVTSGVAKPRANRGFPETASLRLAEHNPRLQSDRGGCCCRSNGSSQQLGVFCVCGVYPTRLNVPALVGCVHMAEVYLRQYTLVSTCICCMSDRPVLG